MNLQLNNWENPVSGERIELVFAERNQNYGAYVLRKSYERNLLLAFFLSLLFATLFALTPLIYNSLFKVASVIVKPETFVVLDVQKFDDKKIEIPKQEIPPKEIKSNNSGNNSNIIPLVVDSSDKSIDSQEKLSQQIQGTGKGIDTTLTADLPDIPEHSEHSGKSEIRIYSQEMPAFPGGDDAMLNFISKNLKYPAEAREDRIEGTVYISFVVDENGDLQNIETKRGIGGGCEDEAMRVIHKMPRWKPGKDNGRAVNVQFVLPIRFILK